MKQTLVRFIAQNQLEQAIDLLFEIYTAYMKAKPEVDISQNYNNLIMLSGKLQSVIQDQKVGIIRFEDAAIAKAQVRNSFMAEINALPKTIFEVATDLKTSSAVQKSDNLTLREQITLSQSKDFQYDIFLSFSSKDIEYIKPICQELRGYGLRVFFSDDNLRLKAGASFFETIDNALQTSKNFVLACTPNSMQSEYVRDEYETFYQEYTMRDRASRLFVIYAGPNYSINLVPVRFRRFQIAFSVGELVDAFIDRNAMKTETIDNKKTSQSAKTEPIETENSAWEKAIDEYTVESLTAFVNLFPDGKNILSAKKILTRLCNEENERLAKLESERLEKERLAKLESERLEKERLAKAESERLEKERLAKLESERLEKERLAKLESERLEKERLAKLESERLEKERLAKLESERLEKERLAKLESERLEKERLAKLESERLEKERLAKTESERLEKERIAKAESERLEKERIVKAETERLEKERIAKAESERLEKEQITKVEAERLEKERIAKTESERLEKERIAKAEAERDEKARQEKIAKDLQASQSDLEASKPQPAAKAEAQPQPTQTPAGVGDSRPGSVFATQPKPTAEPKPNNKKYIYIAAAVFVLIATIIYFATKGPNAQEIAEQNRQDSIKREQQIADSIANAQAQRQQDSIATAKRMRDSLEMLAKNEDNFYNQTKTQNTLEAYNNYVKTFPSGKYLKQAKQEIAKMEKTENERKLNESQKSRQGTFTDSRDGKTYKTIRIGNQTWFTENLAYKANSGCWAYDDKQSNVAKFGYLYDWETAKTVCPAGWHLPSDEEWKQLEMALGMTKKEADETGWRGDGIGTKLKSTSGWESNGNGTNASGFNALPAGSRDSDGAFGSAGAGAGLLVEFACWF